MRQCDPKPNNVCLSFRFAAGHDNLRRLWLLYVAGKTFWIRTNVNKAGLDEVTNAPGSAQTQNYSLVA